ncbi:hypothetical protein HCB18_26990 [Salinispora arenicola]|nr:hypothetical protein [Salinispora arenicola]
MLEPLGAGLPGPDIALFVVCRLDLPLALGRLLRRHLDADCSGVFGEDAAGFGEQP